MSESSVMDRFIEKGNFAKTLGIRVTEHAEGAAVTVMEVRAEHLNSFGTVHGAALFALADEAFAVACNSRGQVAMAIQAGISYIKAVKNGVLTATAREVSVNPKLGSYQIEIRDEMKDLVAVFNGMCYRKKETVADMPENPSRC